MILENALRFFLARSIEFYQRHLSPRKGFRCAYGVLHDGESCSQVVKHRVLERGVRGLWKDARHQFELCHAAAETLRAQKSSRHDTHLQTFGREDWRSRWRRKWRDCSSSNNCDACDAAQCACHMPDIVSCCARGGRVAGNSSPCDASPCDGDVCGIEICGCPFN